MSQTLADLVVRLSHPVPELHRVLTKLSADVGTSVAPQIPAAQIPTAPPVPQPVVPPTAQPPTTPPATTGAPPAQPPVVSTGTATPPVKAPAAPVKAPNPIQTAANVAGGVLGFGNVGDLGKGVYDAVTAPAPAPAAQQPNPRPSTSEAPTAPDPVLESPAQQPAEVPPTEAAAGSLPSMAPAFMRNEAAFRAQLSATKDPAERAAMIGYAQSQQLPWELGQDLTAAQADYTKANADAWKDPAARQAGQAAWTQAHQTGAQQGIADSQGMTPDEVGTGLDKAKSFLAMPAEQQATAIQQAELMEAAGGVPPGTAAQLKTLHAQDPKTIQAAVATYGNDPAAYQKALETTAKDAGERVATSIQEKAQQGKTDIMAEMLRDPMSLLLPAGILMMAFGGDTGKILGALAIAGGGYRLWDRFSGVKNGDGGRLLAAAQSEGWKDFSNEGIQKWLNDPATKQRHANLLTAGSELAVHDTLLLAREGSSEMVKNFGQQAGLGQVQGAFYAPDATQQAQQMAAQTQQAQ